MFPSEHVQLAKFNYSWKLESLAQTLGVDFPDGLKARLRAEGSPEQTRQKLVRFRWHDWGVPRPFARKFIMLIVAWVWDQRPELIGYILKIEKARAELAEAEAQLQAEERELP